MTRFFWGEKKGKKKRKKTPRGSLSRNSYLVAVPAGDGGAAADVGEVGDVALRLPAVARGEAVGAVGAADGGEGAGGVVVAGVVGDCAGREWWISHEEMRMQMSREQLTGDGLSGEAKRQRCKDAGELHDDVSDVDKRVTGNENQNYIRGTGTAVSNVRTKRNRTAR